MGLECADVCELVRRFVIIYDGIHFSRRDVQLILSIGGDQAIPVRTVDTDLSTPVVNIQ